MAECFHVTLPMFPNGWFDLPPEQRRQWDQLQLQDAHYEWIKAVRLENRRRARSRGLDRLFPMAVTLLLLGIFIADLSIIMR